MSDFLMILKMTYRIGHLSSSDADFEVTHNYILCIE